jgi:glycosyltransferase involved in cell wall biosynthesis
MHRDGSQPRVSVLMPTFKHAAFIRRALESLRAQAFTGWELIIVDDGSPDCTDEVVEPYLRDSRIRYHRWERNQGLGAALNFATSQARGDFLAYLPSDDVYYPEHLDRLVRKLDSGVYLAYGGVRWNYSSYTATLQGDSAVGREAEILADPPIDVKNLRLPNGNILALVQVMHRRDHEPDIRWTARSEKESDTLEPDFWRALISKGADFGYTGAVTCEWVDHKDQRHKIIDDGLSRYRRYYEVGREWLNWQPSRGPRVNERERFGRFDQVRDLPSGDRLKILMVGDLGFNPERIMAFEERGHKLYGLWTTHPENWDTTGPLPYGNMEDIPYDCQWRERVRAIQPDVIYALLNWQTVKMAYEVFEANLGIPFVYHFKEGPLICFEKGTWPMMVRLLTETDGQILINDESYEWFQCATDGALDPDRIMILDGDLPKLDWFTDDWSPKLSALDGEVHTVCPGRPIGIAPFEEIAAAKIHVHFYGVQFHQVNPNMVRVGKETGYLHLHDTILPVDWVRELSKYDAAWFHVFDSNNGGDLRRAIWDDLNLPARLGTFAAAGLPWILKDNRHSRVALISLAQKYDVGVYFKDFADLGDQLRDRKRLARLTENMRAARHEFAFDTHADKLIAFLRKAIERQSGNPAKHRQSERNIAGDDV